MAARDRAGEMVYAAEHARGDRLTRAFIATPSGLATDTAANSPA